MTTEGRVWTRKHGVDPVVRVGFGPSCISRVPAGLDARERVWFIRDGVVHGRDFVHFSRTVQQQQRGSATPTDWWWAPMSLLKRFTLFLNMVQREYLQAPAISGDCCFGGVSFLWPLYFCPVVSFYLSSIYLSFFPRLISAATDWMSTILLHMAWP